MNRPICSLVLLLIGIVCICRSNGDNVQYAPIVHLKDGPVRGIVQDVEDGHKVHLYQGIRYGRAERFAKPRPVEPWSEVYNATKWRDACPQIGIGKSTTQTSTMSEDCLFVNVWRPAEEMTTKAVMVWIHGGGFETGTIFSQSYDARYMASRGDVIVVAVEYRLSHFGFLFGGTEDAPGNVGVHDQILALRWVQRNIKHFGGDPSKVTVFGESAGGISIGAMLISPLSKGLFHRAIIQSGTPNVFKYASRDRTSALELTKMVAHKLNCSAASMSDTLKCLRSKSVNEIIAATKVNAIDYYRDQFIALTYGDDLIPVEPVKAVKSGKFQQDIDILYGVTNNEGSSFATILFPDLRTNQTVLTLDKIKQDIEIMTKFVGLPFDGKEAAEFYTKRFANVTQNDLRLALANTFGDLVLICPTILFSEQLAKQSPKNHHYSYRLMLPSTIPVIDCQPWMGVCHATDLVYMFLIPLQMTSEERQLSHDLIRAWTNFAKHGHPGAIGSVRWTEALEGDNASTKFMSLKPNKYQMVSEFYRDNCESFWKPKIFQ